MQQYNMTPNWQKLSVAERRSVIMKLLDELDLSQRALRMKAARSILYLAQVRISSSLSSFQYNVNYDYRVPLLRSYPTRSNRHGHALML